MQNTQKRTLIATVNAELQKLSELDPVTAVKIDLSLLKTSFAQLVDSLALGEEPETRPCPKCGKLGMRTATVCGYCWTKTPVAQT